MIERLLASLVHRIGVLEAIECADPTTVFTCEMCREPRSADGLRRNRHLVSPRLICPVCICRARRQCDVCFGDSRAVDCSTCWECERTTCGYCVRWRLVRKRKRSRTVEKVVPFCFACWPDRDEVSIAKDFRLEVARSPS